MAARQTDPERPEESDHGEMADYESIMVNPEGRMVPVVMSVSLHSKIFLQFSFI